MYKKSIKWLKFLILGHLRNLLCIVSKLMWNEHLILVCNLTQSRNLKDLILAACLLQWEVHKLFKCINNMPKSYNCIFTYSGESVTITLLEFFYTCTSQLHLLLAVNNTVQHYKLSTHFDLAFYSNWSNLNSCKPELI